MATVKILYNQTAKHLERYLLEHQAQALAEGTFVPQTEHLVFLEGMTQEFAQVQAQLNTRSGNGALHLVQSWKPQESQLLSPAQIHGMGVALAQRFAPGHQFVIQTHTDQPHHHNHIVINPVHFETGKRIQNKLENVHALRDLNDVIAREHGLSVLPPQASLKRPGPNEKAQRIEAYRGKSYIVDLTQKAHFARAHAANFEQYLELLSGFNIEARIENQTITYFYPGRAVGKRGKNLAPELDKAGLEKKFADHRTPKPLAPQVGESKLSSSSASSLSFESLIPLEEIQKAKAHSILQYCRKEKIALVEQVQDGERKRVLKGREHVELFEYHWINHKNKTQGTVIDFVANHQKSKLFAGGFAH